MPQIDRRGNDKVSSYRDDYKKIARSEHYLHIQIPDTLTTYMTAEIPSYVNEPILVQIRATISLISASSQRV